jgi:DNA-binding transcriptional regulator LsrR (DeoR family)
VTNNDWQADPNSGALGVLGFAPSNSKEAAILATLQPGAYTVIVTGAGNTTGVAIVEVFKVP